MHPKEKKGHITFREAKNNGLLFDKKNGNAKKKKRKCIFKVLKDNH